MTRAVRIDNRYLQVGKIEREVVVTAVPEDDIATLGVLFSSPQDGFIIYASIDDIAADDVRFILFHFLHGAFVFSQI
jgi:hypothetical protein